MKEILEALGTRIRSPLFGYYVLMAIVINWKVTFNLLFSNTTTFERIAYFDSNTDVYSLVLYPLSFSVFAAIFYPWLNYGFLVLCKKPTELRNTIQAQSEHELLIKKQALERTRSQLLESAESELFERAVRDEKINKIEDEDIKDKLKAEINQLRNERDILKKSPNDKPDYNEYKTLLELADRLRERATKSHNADDRESFKDQARELENRAHTMIQGKVNA